MSSNPFMSALAGEMMPWAKHRFVHLLCFMTASGYILAAMQPGGEKVPCCSLRAVIVVEWTWSKAVDFSNLYIQCCFVSPADLSSK